MYIKDNISNGAFSSQKIKGKVSARGLSVFGKLMLFLVTVNVGKYL